MNAAQHLLKDRRVAPAERGRESTAPRWDNRRPSRIWAGACFMQYMALPPVQRAALLGTLEDMPQYLERELGGLAPELTHQQGPDGAFSPVEQVWHLADLEREGFGWRIDTLLSEREPQLPDFDGAAIAAARDYRARSLTAGLAVFRAARQRNLATLRAIASPD